MKRLLSDNDINDILDTLKSANTEFKKSYPGNSSLRQPIHTVYGGAHLFKSNASQKLGNIALKILNEYAPNYMDFAKVLNLPNKDLADIVYSRIIDKLKKEPVEDFRIDFEDGYGCRSEQEEDNHAQISAKELALGLQNNTLPPFIGLRIKPFTEELKVRAARTLDIFLSTLLENTKGKLPNNFVITLPKITLPKQVEALVNLLEKLEHKSELKTNSLKLEIMIEAPQTVVNKQGKIILPDIIAAANGRCVAAHFGAYDYTSALNIAANAQHLDHPACDFVRNLIQIILAETGISLSDSINNILPIVPHKSINDESSLTEKQIIENKNAIYKAWKVHYNHIKNALHNGYYQGWDLHPGQLPIRYAASYVFFLDNLNVAAARLKTFVEMSSKASLSGQTFDDAATGQGLINFFLKGLSCGAIVETDLKQTGLTLVEMECRSFATILNSRISNK